MSASPHRSHAQACAGAGCIDVHYHILPPQVLAASPVMTRIFADMPGVSGWSPASALDAMDRDGVLASMLSFPTPSMAGADVQDQRDLARVCNEFYADLVRQHPTRFGLFAGLPPLTDLDSALAEIDYAYDVLQADGVRVMSVYRDRWLGDPSFEPVWAELDRRAAVVFVHPDMPACCTGLPNFAALELPMDTARTAESLWRTGVLRKYPRIRFILSHGGGALPMIAGRLLDRIELPGGPSVPAAAEGLAAFRAFYFDTANAATPPALAATLALADGEKVLFGTDYPFVSVAKQVAYIAASGLTPGVVEAIRSGNAMRLLPKFDHRPEQ